MGGDLAIAVAVFLASAASVIYLGVQLAKYGDALAGLTGLGRVFIGSILVALVTSLPELSTNFAAVRLDPSKPRLGHRQHPGRQHAQHVHFRRSGVGVRRKGLPGAGGPGAGLFGVVGHHNDRRRRPLWLGQDKRRRLADGLEFAGPALGLLGGMWIVYVTRPQENETDGGEGPGISLRRAWTIFILVSVGVVIAGFFLAWSADRIADITGVASSTLGILAVSLVTTMPEASATIAAAAWAQPTWESAAWLAVASST